MQDDKIIVLTPDEIVDFALRVARFALYALHQPDSMPAYMLSLFNGAVNRATCEAFLLAYFHEATHPALSMMCHERRISHEPIRYHRL